MSWPPPLSVQVPQSSHSVQGPPASFFVAKTRDLFELVHLRTPTQASADIWWRATEACTVAVRRYASYWNAFLFILNFLFWDVCL